jgi:hypothetical protein
MAETREFWDRLSDCEPVTSSVTRREILRHPVAADRARLSGLLCTVRVLPVTSSMLALAREYVHAGIFGARSANDARHIAAAVGLNADWLVSWNFRHLVNTQRCERINSLNAMMSLPAIRVVTPRDLWEGADQ